MKVDAVHWTVHEMIDHVEVVGFDTNWMVINESGRLEGHSIESGRSTGENFEKKKYKNMRIFDRKSAKIDFSRFKFQFFIPNHQIFKSELYEIGIVW